MLEAQFKKIEKTLNRSNSTLELTKNIFLTANRAKNEFLNSEKDKKHDVLNNLFWNLEVKDREMASVSFKMPYEILKNHPKNGDFSTLLGC